VAVVIDELESIVEGGAEPAAAPAGEGAAPAGGGALDDDGFRLKYGRIVRELVREELERQRRSRAD
jgi:hypothetical protein